MLRYILGVVVTRSKKGIFLFQRKYVFNLLTETREMGAMPYSAPIVPNLQPTKNEKLFKDHEQYKRLIGKLNYFTAICSDIAYFISVLSQFMSSPILHHWQP